MTGANGDRREITALESILRKSVLSRKGFLCAAFGQRGRCEYVTAVCAYANKSWSLFLSNRVAPANECPPGVKRQRWWAYRKYVRQYCISVRIRANVTIIIIIREGGTDFVFSLFVPFPTSPSSPTVFFFYSTRLFFTSLFSRALYASCAQNVQYDYYYYTRVSL